MAKFIIGERETGKSTKLVKEWLLQEKGTSLYITYFHQTKSQIVGLAHKIGFKLGMSHTEIELRCIREIKTYKEMQVYRPRARKYFIDDIEAFIHHVIRIDVRSDNIIMNGQGSLFESTPPKQKPSIDMGYMEAIRITTDEIQSG